MSDSSSSQTAAADLLAKLKANVDSWSQLVKGYADRSNDKAVSEDEREAFKALTSFIDGPLINRLMGIYNDNNELKERYLKAIEPFYTKEGLQTFIEQHFDIELDSNDQSLNYRKKEPFEKEVSVLFLLFKVKKTIETINTIQKTVNDEEDSFPSSFTKEMQQDYLSILKEILKLFFIKFVKKEYLKSVFTKLSEKQFNATGLTNRREKGITYIKDKTLAGKEVREFFSLLFFSNVMRTIRKNKIVNIEFNYLDFELMKNEFLIDWLQRKLKGNEHKDKIYAKYRIKNKSLKELVKENPDKEGEYLQQIPLEEFNDLAEEINQAVDEKDKTPVPTLSKNHGEMARSENMFNKAKKLAKMPLAKMKQWLSSKKKEKYPKSEFSIQIINEHEIDFVFFDEKTNTYENKLNFLKKKLGDTQHESFRDNLWTFFEYVSNDHLIKREEPIKEWAIPFFIKNGDDERLLIIGAEISQKKTKSGVKFSNYEFSPYFVYGLNKQDDECGRLLGTRKAKTVEFFCYSYAEEKIQKEALNFFHYITLEKDNPVFKSSDIRFKSKKDQVKTEELIQMDDSLLQGS